jgi:3-hydroxyisobutyrate dehydrogenase-like beta-hydroxyacid dehydrogenase
VLEMSTISPQSSREPHRIGAKSGIEVLDVAISGSTPAAGQGILTLLAGGNQDLFLAAEPIFQAIARQHFLLGGPGSGTAMKLVVKVRQRIKALTTAGKTMDEAVATAPTKTFDAKYGSGYVTPDVFTKLVFSSLTRNSASR